MSRYQLKKANGELIPITIEECAKEDFKELMDWDEETFLLNTVETKES